MEVNQRGRGVLVSARTMSNLNLGITMLPTNLFSIQLSNNNSNVNSRYRGRYNLDFTDQTILKPSSSGNKTNSFYEYDLHVAAIGYDYEPGQYFYSILITISQQ